MEGRIEQYAGEDERQFRKRLKRLKRKQLTIAHDATALANLCGVHLGERPHCVVQVAEKPELREKIDTAENES